MVNNCPNKSHPDWVHMVNTYGEDAAWALYIQNGGVIPSQTEVENMLNLPETQANLGLNQKREQLTNGIRTKTIEYISELGIGAGALSELESIQGSEGGRVNGVFNPVLANTNAKGISELIHISQGNRSNTVLTPEFARFIHASMRGNPLITRLESLMDNENVIRDVFEQDQEGSFETQLALAREAHPQDWRTNMIDQAVDKLIHRHIIQGQAIPSTPWQSLMQRVKNQFNTTFSRGDVNALQEQIARVDQDNGGMLSQLLEGQSEVFVSNDVFNNTNQLADLTRGFERAKSIHKRINETEHKRLKLLESNRDNAPETLERAQSRNTLLRSSELLYSVGMYEEGIGSFLEQAINDLRELTSIASELKLYGNTPTSELNNTAKVLREIKSYIDAYKPILADVIAYYSTSEASPNVAFEQSARDLNYLITQVENDYRRIALPIFRKFLSRFWGENETIEINFGSRGQRSYTIDSLLEEAESDIGFFDRWLYSMGESTDMLLRLIEQPVKRARLTARENTNEAIRRLQAAQIALEQAGHNTEFIYERNADGELTGRYLTEFDRVKFEEDRRELIDRLDSTYGNRNISSEWNREYFNWLREHTDTLPNSTTRVPKLNMYTNPVYARLTPAQKTFLNTVTSIKQEIDDLLPDYKVDSSLLPQVRKNWVERLKASKDTGSALSLLREGVLDDFVERESDDEFGSRRTLRGFDNSEVHLLPVYYTSRLDDMNQLSTDIVSTMALYANMGYNYSAMSNIVDLMELGKDLLTQRQINETRGSNPLIEKFNREGRTIENKILKPTNASRFEARLNDFFESQIYGRYMQDEGVIQGTNISKAKLANQINRFTSLNTFALNALAGVANVGMGDMMLRIEAIAGEYLGASDVVWADKTYGKHLPGTVAALGKRLKDDKMSLFIERFNVLQDYESSLREIDMNQKNFFLRHMQTSSLFFMNNIGEHWMQSRTGLAVAHRYKLKDRQGREVNLWDAMEVTHRDGIPRLELKQGVTKLDGSEFTQDDLFKLQNRMRGINQRLHGIYNKEDMNAFQRTGIGRLAMMFRKWMIPSINRRFQRSMYSFDLDTYTEGYYNTAFQFMKQLFGDLKSMQFNMTTHWRAMNKTQRSNILRALTEVGQLFALMLTFALLEAAWDGDDEWGKNFALYQIRRLQTEIGALVPGPQMAGEFFTIVKSPAAGVNYIQNVMNVMDLTEWWGEPLQSGRYKGETRGYRNLMRIVPFNNTIYRAMNPEEASKFFLLSDK